MAKQKTTTSPDYHVRILKTETLDMIAKIQEGSNLKKNEIINQALEIGLPCLLEDINPQGTINTAMQSVKAELLVAFKSELSKIKKTLSDMSITQYIDELMISATLQQFEYLLSHQDVKSVPPLPEQVRDRMDITIPDRFNKIKMAILQKFMEDSSVK